MIQIVTSLLPTLRRYTGKRCPVSDNFQPPRVAARHIVSQLRHHRNSNVPQLSRCQSLYLQIHSEELYSSLCVTVARLQVTVRHKILNVLQVNHRHSPQKVTVKLPQMSQNVPNVTKSFQPSSIPSRHELASLLAAFAVCRAACDEPVEVPHVQASHDAQDAHGEYLHYRLE